MPLTAEEQDQVDQHIADKGVRRFDRAVGLNNTTQLFWRRQTGKRSTVGSRQNHADDLAATQQDRPEAA